MTLKTTCRCGSEFYISVITEDYATQKFIEERYNTFINLHKKCYNDIMDELPEDWKV